VNRDRIEVVEELRFFRVYSPEVLIKNHPMLRASHERLLELMAVGCPIDYSHALPRNSFRVEPLAGYIPSCVSTQSVQWILAG
jgi:hypothetical protein